jgi:transposase
LSDEGYEMHLANPTKIQQYSGQKHSDDKDDAFWLAEMLRLKILPEGYVYPKEKRPLRDLLRKRGHLVRLRTSLIVSLQNILARNIGDKMKTSALKALKEDRVTPLLAGNDDISLAGRVSKEAIDSLTRQINAIEVVVEKKMDLGKPYDLLLSMPGVGRVLALTIMMETGPIGRFAKVATMCLTAGKFQPDDLVMKRRKALATGRMAISICHGRMQRHQSLHGVLTLKRGPIMIGSGGRQTHR